MSSLSSFASCTLFLDSIPTEFHSIKIKDLLKSINDVSLLSFNHHCEKIKIILIIISDIK